MVETQDTAISDVIDQRRIIDLPLNGRQATDLILLAGRRRRRAERGRAVHHHPRLPDRRGRCPLPAASPTPTTTCWTARDHSDTHSNVNLPFPFPDALQEFSVQTGGLSAR